MSVHDVPRSRWADVLEQFSRGHRGWLASLVTVCPGAEMASWTDWYPFESVTVARTGGRTTAIHVKFQGSPSVCIKAPRTLGIDTREDGAERALEIDAGEAEFVRLAFRATARPEEVDGIAPAELVESNMPIPVSSVRGRSRGPVTWGIKVRHVRD